MKKTAVIALIAAAALIALAWGAHHISLVGLVRRIHGGS
jgi:hypothetical protein